MKLLKLQVCPIELKVNQSLRRKSKRHFEIGEKMHFKFDFYRGSLHIAYFSKRSILIINNYNIHLKNNNILENPV